MQSAPQIEAAATPPVTLKPAFADPTGFHSWAITLARLVSLLSAHSSAC